LMQKTKVVAEPEPMKKSRVHRRHQDQRNGYQPAAGRAWTSYRR
jgi:hypothetical protein